MPQLSRQRLDVKLVELGLVTTRSQAESYIKLFKVRVNDKLVTKSGYPVSDQDNIAVASGIQYVSRAALKLQSVAEKFNINFKGQKVLDIGSSTGGFTDYSLRHGASRVIAVEVGSDQMHPSLLGNPAIELHEKTDIRVIQPFRSDAKATSLSFTPDIVLVDLSFISLREVLPHVSKLINQKTRLIVMVKPQFESQLSGLKHKGVVKNEKMRRTILKDFESWASQRFIILDKSDSKVAGAKGNLERFYLLAKLSENISL